MRRSRIVDDEAVHEKDLRHTGPFNKVTVTTGQPEPVVPPAAPASAPSRLFSAAKKHFFPGAKKVTASTIGEQIAALTAEIGREEQRREAAAKLLADPSFLSDDAHSRAEADLSSAVRAKARLAGQIAHLEADQAVQQKIEAEEAFSRRVEQLRKQGQEVERRLKAEYVAAAQTISDLMGALTGFNHEKERLAEEAKALGLTIDIADPLAFRNATSKERYGAHWPNVKPRERQLPDRVTKINFAEGTAIDESDFRSYDHVISGSIEDAPVWAVRWVDGVPEPACESVEIKSRGRVLAPSLLASVCLPALMWDGKPFVTPAA